MKLKQVRALLHGLTTVCMGNENDSVDNYSNNKWDIQCDVTTKRVDDKKEAPTITLPQFPQVVRFTDFLHGPCRRRSSRLMS